MPSKVWIKCPCTQGCYIQPTLRCGWDVISDQDIWTTLEGILPQCFQCGLFQNNVNFEKHLSFEDCKEYTEKRYDSADITNQQKV